MITTVLTAATDDVPPESMQYRVRVAVLADIEANHGVCVEAITAVCHADPRDVYAAVDALVRKGLVDGQTLPHQFGLRAYGDMHVAVA
jgi:hypothetical protein